MSSTNPFNTLLASSPSPHSLVSAYQTHRSSRNSSQRALHIASGFHPTRDTILHSIITTGTPDPRNCLVLWSRPPSHIISLIIEIQSRLSQLIQGSDFASINTAWPSDNNATCLNSSSPGTEANNDNNAEPVELTGGKGQGGVWWMPPTHLHMTVMEAMHSVTAAEVESAISKLPKGSLQDIANIPSSDKLPRVVLTSPRIGFDGSALAVGFAPAYESAEGGNVEGEWYSYHHLRRDVWDAAAKVGLKVESRYVVPSAHATIMRYVDEDVGFVGGLEGWVNGIEEINKWLEKEWDSVKWVVAQEKGLMWRKGRLWYGGGETVVEGKRREA